MSTLPPQPKTSAPDEAWAAYGRALEPHVRQGLMIEENGGTRPLTNLEMHGLLRAGAHQKDEVNHE